ncbi:hypothetical protein Pelo_15760 [Pelomyxa schiedti]|nr:hypothetical protein Pelo_15760 [Pelomyxa schiedti]
MGEPTVRYVLHNLDNYAMSVAANKIRDRHTTVTNHQSHSDSEGECCPTIDPAAATPPPSTPSSSSSTPSGGTFGVVVWNGMCANVAESSLSYLVHHCAPALASLTYFPGRTKGGMMLRPRYHLGQRTGRVQFGALTALAMRAGLGTPRQWGWVCPALRRLVLVRPPPRNPGGGGGRAYGAEYFDEAVEDAGFRAKILQDSPALRSIELAEALDWDAGTYDGDGLEAYAPPSDSSSSGGGDEGGRGGAQAATITFGKPLPPRLWNVVAVMYAPYSAGWERIRLVLLVQRGKESPAECALCQLRGSILDMILGYLFRGWVVVREERK